MMGTVTEYIELATDGNTDIRDVTDAVRSALARHGCRDGLATVFVPGATGAVTTLEMEPGLVRDTARWFAELADPGRHYEHDETHRRPNAVAHLRAALVGPSETFPVTAGEPELGTWQRIVFIDFDTRPRDRRLTVKFVGECDGGT